MNNSAILSPSRKRQVCNHFVYNNVCVKVLQLLQVKTMIGRFCSVQYSLCKTKQAKLHWNLSSMDNCRNRLVAVEMALKRVCANVYMFTLFRKQGSFESTFWLSIPRIRRGCEFNYVLLLNRASLSHFYTSHSLFHFPGRSVDLCILISVTITRYRRLWFSRWFHIDRGSKHRVERD